MTITQAQKNAKNKWDRNNLTTISCRVTKLKATQFKEACCKLETIPNRVLLKAIDETIKKALEIEDLE